MAVAHAVVCAATDLIPIETDQPRRACKVCHRVLIEAQFWAFRHHRWSQSHTCSCCRWRARMGEPIDRPETEQERHEIERMHRTEKAQELALLTRLAWERTKKIPTVLRDKDGRLRCGQRVGRTVCGSTLYRQVVPLWRNRHAVEWLCWMAGHVVLERWRHGPLVPGEFPEGDRQEVLRRQRLRDAAKTVSRVIPMTGYTEGTTMGVVYVNAKLVDGCTSACQMIRYRDADDLRSPVYVTIRHDPEAHNAYRALPDGEAVPVPRKYLWNGLFIDPQTGVARAQGKDTNLSAIERTVLLRLLTNAGHPVSREDLIRSVWGAQEDDGGLVHILRVHLNRLRRKLDKNDPQRFIHTCPNYGYILLPWDEGTGEERAEAEGVAG